MKVMYLDESGNHDLRVSDSDYPVFVLGGVIVDGDYATGELSQRVVDFKRQLFGRDDIILHTADIKKNRNGFECLRDPEFRAYFYEALNGLMRSLDYQVVACAIRKETHLERYGLNAADPYLLSLHVVVERFCFELSGDTGHIVAEARRPDLDAELRLAWEHLKVRGTAYVTAKAITSRIIQLQIQAKKRRVAGLELADLVVNPIGRYVLGKPMHEDWEVIKEKLRRHNGEWHGAGLMILPK